MKHITVVSALVAGVLFAFSNAGRHSDVAKRGGFTKQLLERPAPQRRQVVNSTEYRFYSNTTARKLVPICPDSADEGFSILRRVPPGYSTRDAYRDVFWSHPDRYEQCLPSTFLRLSAYYR